jgi:5-methylcytosine-specific restriction enzyme A
LARLKTLANRLGGARPRLAVRDSGDRRGFDQERDRQPWRRWYKTARWQALRWAVLVRDGFTCQMCGRVEPDSSRLVADHRQPHRGDEALFWDARNLWTLCKSPCHDSVKQREERASGL